MLLYVKIGMYHHNVYEHVHRSATCFNRHFNGILSDATSNIFSIHLRFSCTVLMVLLYMLTCICLTAGVNLLTPSGHRQIRDVITTGIDMCGRRMRKGGGGGWTIHPSRR